MDVNAFHSLVWKKFIRMPYGHVIDYTDSEGTLYVPTAKECRNAMPNPLGWWTPLENGAFFTGLYAYSLIAQYNRNRDEKTAEEIRVLIKGLFLLQDVGGVEGFIARGVADDGISHYPFSSDDQFAPWVLALYSFYQSDVCTCREEVKERLIRTITAVKNNGWCVPCEAEGLYYGKMGSSAEWRGVCKVLFCARVLYELTGAEADLRHYEALATENPSDSIFTRLEIASHGYSHDLVAILGTKQNWICASAHLGLRELIKMDPQNAAYFHNGLRNNGITALGVVDDMKKYDNCKDGFDVNWRRLNALWEDYRADMSKALLIANRENAFWLKEVAPHRRAEHDILGNAVFSALIAITCGDPKIAGAAKEKLIENCRLIDWQGLHVSYAFVVECGMILADVPLSEKS